jgi:hypothetical protein
MTIMTATCENIVMTVEVGDDVVGEAREAVQLWLDETVEFIAENHHEVQEELDLLGLTDVVVH